MGKDRYRKANRKARHDRTKFLRLVFLQRENALHMLQNAVGMPNHTIDFLKRNILIYDEILQDRGFE